MKRERFRYINVTDRAEVVLDDLSRTNVSTVKKGGKSTPSNIVILPSEYCHYTLSLRKLSGLNVFFYFLQSQDPQLLWPLGLKKYSDTALTTGTDAISHHNDYNTRGLVIL